MSHLYFVAYKKLWTHTNIIVSNHDNINLTVEYLFTALFFNNDFIYKFTFFPKVPQWSTFNDLQPWENKVIHTSVPSKTTFFLQNSNSI